MRTLCIILGITSIVPLVAAQSVYTVPHVIDATGGSSSLGYTPYATVRVIDATVQSSRNATVTNSLLSRNRTAVYQPVHIVLGDCPAPQDKNGGMFGSIPDINNCGMFGPVPRLDEYWPRP